jgi:hypothetical protein
MTQRVQAFCDWLAATPLSLQIQTVGWIIPTVQTLHILSIALVVAAAALLDLHLLGVMLRGQPLAAVAQRFLPWIWSALSLLLLTGSLLIVGEPGRSLRNPAFIAKMSMLGAVLVLMLIFQGGLRRDRHFWQRSGARRWSARLFAVLSLCLWVGIVFAGRWIAYIDVDAI